MAWDNLCQTLKSKVILFLRLRGKKYKNSHTKPISLVKHFDTIAFHLGCSL